MSIINQVLKDIDNRSKEDAKGNRRRAAYTGRPRRVRIWVWIALGVLCAALVVVGLYFVGQHQQSATPLSAEEDMVVQFTPPQLPAREESGAGAGSEQQSGPEQQATPSRRQQRAEVRVIDAPSQPESSQLESSQSEATEAQAQEIFSADSIAANAGNEELTDDEVTLTGVTKLSSAVRAAQGQSSQQQTPQQQAQTAETASQREPANEFSIQRSAPTSTSQPQRLFEQALSDLDAGNARRASQALQQVLILDPEHIEAREELAAYYFGRGFISDAMEVLEGGLALVPQANSLRLLQARILERIDQPERALDVTRQADIRLPDDADLLILKGALATELEHYGDAAEAYQQLVAWRPDQGRWWIGLAIARENLNDNAGALQAYRRALQDGALNHSSREFVKDRMEALSF